MASNRNIVYFFRNLRRKFRVSVRDPHNSDEVWYMHISPLEMMGAFVAFVLILFIIILTTVAYTPILNLIPGYSGNNTREMMIQNIMRVDSIERRLNELQVYTTDVSMIMEGKTPVMRNITQAEDSLVSPRTGTVVPDRADSILREQLEGTGIYGLSGTQGRRGARSGNELVPPVRGVITSYFSPRDGRYGIGIATTSNQQVLAVEEGTVIMSYWSPESGYVVQLQHTNNLVSIYRNAYQVLKSVGSRVRGGEVIAYTGDGTSGEEAKGILEFELWQNGSPIDPENYIVF